VHEIEWVDDTILLEVDDENEHESFEHDQIVMSEITKGHPTQPWIPGTTALWMPSWRTK
jgi:hypothetical protein